MTDKPKEIRVEGNDFSAANLPPMRIGGNTIREGSGHVHVHVNGECWRCGQSIECDLTCEPKVTKAVAEQTGRIEKLRTLLALLPAGQHASYDPSADPIKRLMKRVATDLGYWPLNGVSIGGLYARACADLERELYGDAVPPPPAKGDTWE